jgi:hypothetical protein
VTNLLALISGHDETHLETARRIAGRSMNSNPEPSVDRCWIADLTGPFDGDHLTVGVRRGQPNAALNSPE